MVDPAPPGRSSSWSTISPSSDFYYRPSGEILSGYFRIVQVLPGRYEDPVQCRLQEVYLRDSNVQFMALSYCWNNGSAEDTIYCDDRAMKITPNLFAALRNARATSSTMNLWIDQLCIDQKNIIDRNEQVSKMGAIYRAAGCVIVWFVAQTIVGHDQSLTNIRLGEEGIGTNDAMGLPRKIARYWPRLFNNPQELLDPQKTPKEIPRWGEHPWPAFIALLTRPWFRRLWIIQEVACAKSVLVTCGKATSFWDDFVGLVQVVETVHQTITKPSHLLGLKKTIHYITFMQELRSITEQGTKQAVKDYASEESMAPYVLMMAKDCEATDHRDKLFAFHHLVRLWNRPDYAMDIDTLYKLFAGQYLQRIAYAISEFSCDEKALSRRQMEILYSAGTCNQTIRLPSWVPDWSLPWQARPLWLGSKSYCAGGTDVKEIAPTAEVDQSGNPTFRVPLTVKLFDKVLGAGSQNLTLAIGHRRALPDALRAWIFEARGLVHRRRAAQSPYQDQHEAMARITSADQDTNGVQLSREDAIKQYDALLESLREVDEEEEFQRHQTSAATEQAAVSSYAASFVRGRVFFLTEKGYFGIAQAGITAGDHVAIIQGGAVPVVLHPRGPTWQLRCETFVLGIMNGEVWCDATIPAQQIEIV